MWEIINGKKRLDLSKIRSDFKITPSDGIYLIHPKKNMWDWSDEEKCLRSIIINNEGFIVSSSWPKFGNYGEFLCDTELLNYALKNNKSVRFSHKEDGSLCIRSVINNKVILRTRGTLFGGEPNENGVSYGDRFLAIAKEKYPILLNSEWMTDRSLLFEYVAPSNMVVISYKFEDLIFLGFVKHDNLSIGNWHELEVIAKEGNLNLVRLHNLPTDPNKLLEEIKVWKDEGIVARCCDSSNKEDQIFVKIKSAHYLANHRMKFSMRYHVVVEFVEMANIRNEEQLVDELRKCDYDWEVIEMAKGFYQKYLQSCKTKEEVLQEAKLHYEDFFVKDLDRSDPKIRKEFAKIACSKSGLIRPMMFCLYDNRIEQLNNICKKIVISEGKVK